MLKSFFILVVSTLLCHMAFGQKYDYNLSYRSVGAGEFVCLGMGYQIRSRHRLEGGVHFLNPRPIYHRNNEIMRKNLWPRGFTDHLGYHLSYEYLLYKNKHTNTRLSLGFDIDKSGGTTVSQSVVPWLTWPYPTVEARYNYESSPLSTVLKLSSEIPIHGDFFLTAEAGLGWHWSTNVHPGTIGWEIFKLSLPDLSNGIGFISNGYVPHFSVGVRYRPSLDKK
jgi:hypothetical protein